MLNLTRRQIRYICFRIQTEEAGNAVADVAFAPDVRIHMELQDGFDSWNNFAKTWDVGEKAPLVVVARTLSIQSEWNNVLEKEARVLVEVTDVLGNKKKVKTADADNIDGK